MNSRNWNALARVSLISTLLLGIAVSPAPAQDQEERRDEKSAKIEGAWFVQVTIVNCSNGATIRTFPAINTFSPGQIMGGSTAASSPAQLAPGIGTWESTGGQRYSGVTIGFLFDATGVWSGTQKLTHAIRLRGDEILFNSTVQFFDTNNVQLSAGCATGVGHRI